MQQVRASICHPTGLPVFFIFVPDRYRDYQDHELSLERSRYDMHTTVLRQLLEHERQHMPKGIRMPVRRRR